MIDGVWLLLWAAQWCRLAMPYLGAAMGGLINESSGVIDVALEGKLLVGAFAAATTAHATGSLWVGGLAAWAAVALVTRLQGYLLLSLRADPVLTGIAINLFALAGTRVGLGLLYGTIANSPQGPRLGAWGSPLPELLLISALVMGWLWSRTALGYRLRAAGDAPQVLDRLGFSHLQTRRWALVASTWFLGMGGAALSLSLGKFVADMSAGRGYIAIAAVLLGRLRPVAVALACLGFSGLEVLAIGLQLHTSGLWRDLLLVVPYVAVLALLAWRPALWAAREP